MDLLPLRYFQVVARREHISRAAEELNAAQPSVSRAIARLEADLGVPLFDRRGRQVRLNRFGVMFARRVNRALGELDDGRRELADAAELDHGSVAVSSETLLTLSDLLTSFYAEHPGVEVQLYQASADAMARQLRAREVDLCVASQPLTGPALGTIELVREEVLLAVAPHHPLAARDRVTVAALADEPFITTRPGHWIRNLLDRLFADVGLTPRITCEGDELAATLQLIKVGLGIGLIPAMGHQAATDTSVPCLHLDAPDCYRSLTLVWREDAYFSTAAQRFRAVATEHFRTPRYVDARAG